MLQLDIIAIPKDDPIAFTFFTGYMAMLAASVFFFFERSSVDGKVEAVFARFRSDHRDCGGTLLLHEGLLYGYR